MNEAAYYTRTHHSGTESYRLAAATRSTLVTRARYGVSALMSRLLDALVDTISLCKPLSDVFSFRTRQLLFQL